MWIDCRIMTESEKNILEQFEYNIRRLRDKYLQAVQQNKMLENKLRECEEKFQEALQRNSALEQKYNNLKQAKVISLSDSEIGITRERLTKLVREIDRCIESLKK